MTGVQTCALPIYDSLVRREVEVRLPTEFGEFRLIGYTNAVDQAEQIGRASCRERV